ncbi:hypothetical protein SLS53_000256 [Cytospora paraplurivora]|uniref:Uncharacterized protein n=1 Tax=Cytospora paraplurivora TaxID=2898453 RepID=A0AAN9ULU9_9PEZI
MAETTEFAAPKGTLIITGANGGLGVAMVRRIVSRPDLAALHGVYMVRSSTAPALRSAIDNAVRPHSHEVVPLDLTRLQDVRRIAADINSRVEAGEVPPIRALILNAAYLEFTEQTWTEDGFDTSFASAYLGHWLLTLLLLQSMDRESGRIVVINSSAHETTNKSSGDLIAAAFDCNSTLGEQPKGFYLDGEQRREMAAEARDPKKREVLWRDTLRYTGLKEIETILADWA